MAPSGSYQVCKWEVLRSNCVVSEMRLWLLLNLWRTNYAGRFIADSGEEVAHERNTASQLTNQQWQSN